MPVAGEIHRSLKSIEEEYDHLFTVGTIRDEDRGYEFFARLIQRECPSAKTLLDVACGGGYFLRAAEKILGPQISLTGIDLSSKALERAHKECPSAKLFHSSGEMLPFSSERFDVITCWGSMEHFTDIPKSIQEMKRVAGKNARVFILVPNMFWYKDILAVLFTGNRKTRNQTHERFASLGEWQEILTSSGLKVLKTLKYNGIAKYPLKQQIKDWVIPVRFSYHLLFVCSAE